MTASEDKIEMHDCATAEQIDIFTDSDQDSDCCSAESLLDDAEAEQLMLGIVPAAPTESLRENQKQENRKKVTFATKDTIIKSYEIEEGNTLGYTRRKRRQQIKNKLIIAQDIIEFDEKLARANAMRLALDEDVENGIDGILGYPGIEWPVIHKEKIKTSFKPVTNIPYIQIVNSGPEYEGDTSWQGMINDDFQGTRENRGTTIRKYRKTLPKEITWAKNIDSMADRTGWTCFDDMILYMQKDPVRIPDPRNIEHYHQMFQQACPTRNTWFLMKDGETWEKVEDEIEWAKISQMQQDMMLSKRCKVKAILCQYRVTMPSMWNWVNIKIRIRNMQDNDNEFKPTRMEIMKRYRRDTNNGSQLKAKVDITDFEKNGIMSMIEELPLRKQDKRGLPQEGWHIIKKGAVALVETRPDKHAKLKKNLAEEHFDKRSTICYRGASHTGSKWTIEENHAVWRNKSDDEEIYGPLDKPHCQISIFHLGTPENAPALKHIGDGETTLDWYDLTKLVDAGTTRLIESRDGRHSVNTEVTVIKSLKAPVRMAASTPVIGRKASHSRTIERWLIDTGCGYDLVDEGDLKLSGLMNIIVKAPKGIRLKTPAGITKVDNEATLYLPELKESVTARVCPKTPNVLSIGRRCMLDGYAFHWPKLSHKPYLITPAGKVVFLEVDGYIPYLVADGVGEEMSAAAEDRRLDSLMPKGRRKCETTFMFYDGSMVTKVKVLDRFLDRPPRGNLEDVARRTTRDYRSKEIIQDIWLDNGRITREVYHEKKMRVKKYKTRATEESAPGESDADEVIRGSGSSSSNSGRETDVESREMPVPVEEARGHPPEEGDGEALPPQEPANAEEIANRVRNRRRNLQKEAKSMHHLLTHFPKIPEYCTTCRDAKAQHVAHYNKRRRFAKETGIDDYKVEPLTHFGERFTLDHIICRNDQTRSWKGHNDGLTFLDLFTGWRDFRAMKTKTTKETLEKSKEIFGPIDRETKDNMLGYSDSAHELKEAMHELGICLDNSIPGRPSANGRAERNNRHILEAARAVLDHAGLPHRFWPQACEYVCWSFNTTPQPGKENTPHKLRHGEEFSGSIIPFGSKVMFMPQRTDYISKEDKDGIENVDKGRKKKDPKFAAPMHHGIFLGYKINHGGHWSGEYYCCELSNWHNYNFRREINSVTGKSLRELISVQETRECLIEDPLKPEFPLKAAQKFAFGKLEGMAAQEHFVFDHWNGHEIIGWQDLVTMEDVQEKGPGDLEDIAKIKVREQPMSEQERQQIADEELRPLRKFETAGHADAVFPTTVDTARGFRHWLSLLVTSSVDQAWHDALASIVEDPIRLACARARVPILGVKPVFNGTNNEYKGDIVNGRMCRRGKHRRDALHVSPEDWASSWQVAMRQIAGVTGAVQREAWTLEWWEAIYRKRYELMETDEILGVAAREKIRQGREAEEVRDAAPASEDDSNAGGDKPQREQITARDILSRVINRLRDDPETEIKRDEKWSTAYEPGERPLPVSRLYDEIKSRPYPMPIGIRTTKEKHRIKFPDFQVPFNCCVAQPISKAMVKDMNEMRWEHPENRKRDPKFRYEGSAQEALDKEWTRLRHLKTWNEDDVREYAQVEAAAKKEGRTVHFGNVFDICVLKGSELPLGDKGRKYKGRTVFQGNRVWDENWEVAMFQELGSSPASMEASKIADLIGLLPGYCIKQADAKQAYTQAELGGDETWVIIPEDQRPAWWKEKFPGMKTPVCRLNLALYGHPNSGAYWEQHCDAHLKNIGWESIDENDAWRSCYWHPTKKAFLLVYVDDFKLSAKVEDQDDLWKLITEDHTDPKTGVTTKALELEDIEDPGKFLGCNHTVQEKTSPISGKKCKTMTYDMSSFMKQCVEVYCELASKMMQKVITPDKLRKVPTPFLHAGSSGSIKECQGSCTLCQATCSRDQSRHLVVGSDTSEQSDSESDSDDDFMQDCGGRLASVASKILMKILYGARMARPDLLKAVGRLATKVTKWNPQHDADLERLICYINSTLEYKLIGWCNNNLDELQISLFADADFANEPDAKSTNGVFLEIHGSDTRFPIAFISKKQTCVSHSTPEAEIVAADFALRTEGLPMLILFDHLTGKESKCMFHEDNETMITVCKSGKNPTMRHLGRTHRVSIRWLYERFKERWHDLRYVKSEFQAADIFTKMFTNPIYWQQNLRLIHVVDHANGKHPWKQDPIWMEDTTKHREPKKSKNKPPGPKKDGTLPQSQTAKKKRFQMAMIKKMRSAITAAGGAAEEQPKSRQTESFRNRKRALQAGRAPVTFNEILLDNEILMEALEEAVAVGLDDTQKGHRRSQRGGIEKQNKKKSTFDTESDSDSKANTFSNAIFDDPETLRYKRRFNAVKQYDPFTQIMPGNFRRDIRTVFTDTNGRDWECRALGQRRFQCCRNPKAPYFIDKITRRRTYDLNNGRLVEDAEMYNGAVNVTKADIKMENKLMERKMKLEEEKGYSSNYQMLDDFEKSRRSRPMSEYTESDSGFQRINEGGDSDVATAVPDLPKIILPRATEREQNKPENGPYDRLLIEFCCGEDSYMGTRATYNKGCKLIRLTEKDDMSTEKGLAKALKILDDPTIKDGNILLWSAIPCTGGSAWNRYNFHKGSYKTKRKIANHWKLFRAIWKSFVIIAEKVMKLGGCVVNEWPRECEYWRQDQVKEWLSKHNYLASDFDGCMYDLRSKFKKKNGEFKLIRKPWSIAFSPNAEQFGYRLGSTCPNDDPDSDLEHDHAICQGKDTKDTEKYTWSIVKEAHLAFKEFCEQKGQPEMNGIWTRVDKEATNFRIPFDDGPNMKSIYRRITTDLNSGEIIEDDRSFNKRNKDTAQLRLPGIKDVQTRDISTKFFYTNDVRQKSFSTWLKKRKNKPALCDEFSAMMHENKPENTNTVVENALATALANEETVSCAACQRYIFRTQWHAHENDCLAQMC